MRIQIISGLSALLLCLSAAAAHAATVTFAVTLSGTSETFGGEKQKFTGQGTMTIDDESGEMTYSFRLSDGFTISGTGGAAMTPKGRFLGSISTETDGIRGTAVMEGKTTRAGGRLDVAMTAGIPNRLGTGQEGFVLTKIRAKGTRQP